MVSLPLLGQYKVDTTIINEAYTSYVNKELGQALYVKHRLYKGGGKCQRATNWVNDTKLKLVDENQYKGTIYDPKNGKTYDCKVTRDEKGNLNVRGFIGISLIGRTTYWLKVK